MADMKATRYGFYAGLAQLAKDHPEIVCLDADLAKTTGSETFRKEVPQQHFNVGISEQNMVGMSAGLARVGYVPFCASMAVFSAGRAFEIIRNSVAYSRINVKVVGSHGGVTAAADGGSHQCVEDIGAMRSIPNMVILSPCDCNQAMKIARMAWEYNGPVYIRTSREPTENVTSEGDDIVLGKAQVLKEGTDLCIVATGMMTVLANRALEILKDKGINASLVNIHTIKPFDSQTIVNKARKCNGRVLVCEEGNMVAGLTEAVARALVDEDGIRFDQVAIDDRFGQSGDTADVLREYGITKENIAAKAMALVKG